jgi:signal transduction histidine kinase/ActR/RegA family two-component response regulator
VSKSRPAQRRFFYHLDRDIELPEQQSFQEVADLLPEGMLLLSGTGAVVAANRGLTESLGLERAELCGQRLIDLIFDPSETVTAFLTACQHSDSLLFGSLVFRAKNRQPLAFRVGGIRFSRELDGGSILLRLTPHDAESDQLLALNARINQLSQEVARRQRAEDRLRETFQRQEANARRLRAMADASIQLTTALSLDQPVAASLQVVADLSREVIEVHQAAISLDREGSQPVSAISRSEKPLGRPPAEAGPSSTRHQLVVPLIGRDGKTLGHLGLSDKCAGEFTADDEAIAVQFAQIASVAIENADLYQEVRGAARRKQHFLAMLGHELRNPLGPILHGLQVLRLSGVDSTAAEQARTMMERQVQHLARLVDELLDESRLERGRIQLRQERLDLGQLVHTAVSDWRALATVGPSLALEMPTTPVWVMGDATRLAQVLENLLENAFKFTDQGGWVSVRLEADPGRRQAVLRVRDSGAGIDPEMIPRLFQAFTQGDRSLERSRGGLGLGLSVVKRLVELHGGSVQAASEGLGKGAEFTVSLPLADEPLALAGRRADPDASNEPLRVLVVEDNPDAAESLRLLLELLGHDVRVAHSGISGVETAQQWRPEVVVCDIGLPGLDGYHVASELRRSPATASAQLIALTGYGQEEDRRRSLEAGFDVHLTKPAEPEVLQKLIARRGVKVR